MDSIKISQLPEVTPPESADQVPLLDNSGAQTGRTSINNILALIAQSTSGWNSLPYSISSVTANGNRSYSCTVSSQDLTGILNPGMRLRTTRTVAAPTRCTSLNGSSQYYSKSSPAGTTFTDDFTAGGWFKLNSYGGFPFLISRYNGTSGWALYVDSSGSAILAGWNGGSGNYSNVVSKLAVPLGKWFHVAGQLDMSAFTATSTTSYMMFDGQDIPVSVTRGGTNPTALVQPSDDLRIGYNPAGNYFNGKVAQAFYSSAKITQANMRTLHSQGLTASLISTNNVVSAYSFDNAITDLNTTTANNLTASGSAVATNADSPFGTQASGLISSTLDYAIIQSVTYSTDTTIVVQVPEGCTIPTSGGISTVDYGTVKVPYGFPAQRGKWTIESLIKANTTQGSPSSGTWYNLGSMRIDVPIGAWIGRYEAGTLAQTGGAGATEYWNTLSTANNSESDSRMSTYYNANTSNVTTGALLSRQREYNLSASTPYYLNSKVVGTNVTNLFSVYAVPATISFENAFL